MPLPSRVTYLLKAIQWKELRAPLAKDSEDTEEEMKDTVLAVAAVTFAKED